MEGYKNISTYSISVCDSQGACLRSRLRSINLATIAISLSIDEDIEHDAYAPDAKGPTRQLPEFIESAGTKLDHTNTSSTVFSTGATGFLGSLVLHELLHSQTKVRVIARIRAQDVTAGLRWLESTIKTDSLGSPA